MPWLVPSHQAPVLALKLWRPAWFSGLGLVLGSVAPDLAFILRLDETGAPASHTLLGQLWITVPLVLALHALATGLVLPWLLPRTGGGAPLHLHALARCEPPAGLVALARVASSGLIGGLTHVALDGFTHGDESGWALGLFPALAQRVPAPWGATPLYDWLQLLLTIALGAVGLRAWDRMARALPAPGPGAAARWEVRPASARARRATLGLLLVAAAAGAVAGPLLRGAVGTSHGPKFAAYGAVTAACGVAVAAAAVERLRSGLRSESRSEGGAQLGPAAACPTHTRAERLVAHGRERRDGVACEDGGPPDHHLEQRVDGRLAAQGGEREYRAAPQPAPGRLVEPR
jgi:hypothetical protein